MAPEPDAATSSGYCRFGARILGKLGRRLEEQIEGAKIGEDIEYVHQMRVASRRLRAAMPVFSRCFKRREFRGWLREVKKVTRSMGQARDLDVQMAFLTGYLEGREDDPGRIGVERLLASHRGKRASIQPGLVASLDDLRSSTFLAEMERECQRIIKTSSKGKSRSPDLFCGAHFHIASRLDDLLEMEDYVQDEGAVARHHEMRIKAKRLRYTMEIFSGIYPGELKKEISMMKRFQDALGEVHDYDVWTEYLPTFTSELKDSCDKDQKADIEKGLTNLLDHVKGLRRSRYGEFVDLWRQATEDGFFEELRSRIQEGVLTGNRDLRGEGGRRIGIMADIHGNLPALEAVLQDARDRGVSGILNAGDLLGFGVDPNRVVELLCSSGVLSIKGNYDSKVLRGKGGSKDPALKLARKALSRTARSHLEILPERVVLEIGGRKLLMVHGSPGSAKESVLPETPDPELVDLLGNDGADILVMGHTHLPFTREIEGKLLINPGSVGRSYDGDPRASYAILDMDPPSVEIVRLGYDLEKAAGDLRKAGLPEEYAQALLRGIPVEELVARDGKLGRSSLRGRLPVVRKVAEGYGETDGHSEQVRKLSLKLFDQLRGIHGLARRERDLLEAAAVLHDIGWSSGGKAHNKASLRLILKDQELPLSSRERLIVGSIARYHTRGSPRKKHYNYGRLPKEDRRVVKVLSAILRVADGMDYGHCSVVKNIRSSFDDGRVVLKCTGRGDHQSEDRQVAKKKDLFEAVFGRALELEWSPR